MARYRIKQLKYKLQPSKYIIEEHTVAGIEHGFPVKEIKNWTPVSNQQFNTIEECELYIDKLNPETTVVKELDYD